MKLLVWSVLCLMVLGGCSPASATPTVSPESMKGYELYSWESDGTWYFSLLVGTNRLKSLDEIQEPATAIQGIAKLKPVLESLASGQYIFWSAADPLAFPPEGTIQQVQQICQERGLELFIAK